MDILIIPDGHAKPGVRNDRFLWASRFALERQPDIIIDIGDRADMPSLSQYDVGKLPAEGKRYVDDLAAVHQANRYLDGPITQYNNKHTLWKKKTYKPKKVITIGNHEQRIVRAGVDMPKLHGALSLNDLEYAKYGWDVIPFLRPYIVEGISFQHYFVSGIMGRPISGEHPAAQVVKKGYHSSVCGHSHSRQFWETTSNQGKKVFGLITGCYFEHDEHYTTENDRFWRGLVYLKNVEQGQADPEFISIKELQEKYGS